MKFFTLLLSMAFALLCNKNFAQSITVTQSLQINLFLLNSDTTKLADGLLVQFNNSFSAGVDYMDADKFTNLDESLSLLVDGVLLSIDRTPIITNNDTLFINLTKTKHRSYQFQFVADSLNHPGLIGFLFDKYTGATTALNLNDTTKVNFSVNNDAESQDPNRFQVIFEQPSAGPLPLPVTYTSVKAWQQNDNISVAWNVENELNIKQYEIEKSTDGINFNKVATVDATDGSASSAQYNWVDEDLINGEDYYRICSIGNNGSTEYSEVVKVNADINTSGISIYTNPVRDGVIRLQFTNMPTGSYHVKLVTAFGQLITKKSINYAGGTNVESISFNSDIAKGIYELEIIKPDGTRNTYNLAY
jgi:hypothetical protein